MIEVSSPLLKPSFQKFEKADSARNLHKGHWICPPHWNTELTEPNGHPMTTHFVTTTTVIKNESVFPLHFYSSGWLCINSSKCINVKQYRYWIRNPRPRVLTRDSIKTEVDRRQNLLVAANVKNSFILLAWAPLAQQAMAKSPTYLHLKKVNFCRIDHIGKYIVYVLSWATPVKKWSNFCSKNWCAQKICSKSPRKKVWPRTKNQTDQVPPSLTLNC